MSIKINTNMLGRRLNVYSPKENPEIIRLMLLFVSSRSDFVKKKTPNSTVKADIKLWCKTMMPYCEITDIKKNANTI